MARLDKRELSDMPAHWTKPQRGLHLWHLLQDKGIDPNRLYTVQYFPDRQCWLAIQEVEPGPRPRSQKATLSDKECELFYGQATAEFRWTAQVAFGSLAARSTHFARHGSKYELPTKPQETTPAELMHLLGGPAEPDLRVHFDSEGGWQPLPRKDQ
jgi:hypothetical protein